MALQLKTDASFGYREGLLDRPPIPNDAIAYADFCGGLHMDQSDASVSAAAALVFGPVSSMTPGYYYGRDGVSYMASKLWDRVEFDATGACLGLLVEGDYQNRIIPDHRINLAQATATGARVTADGGANAPYQEWFTLTPSGAGAAHVRLSTSTVATAGAYLYIAVDVTGAGVVQLGCAGTGYVNADLRAGTVHPYDDAVAQLIARAGGPWTLFLRARVPAGGLEDVGIYIASIGATDASAHGASGVTFKARAPRFDASTSSMRPIPGLWPHATSNAHMAENLTPNIAGFDPAGDFTCVLRLRSGSDKYRAGAGLFLLTSPSGSGVELRFAYDNALILVASGETVPIWSSGICFAPDTFYEVGVSRTGTWLAVSVNGQTFEADLGARVSGRLPRPVRGFDQESNSWSGHLQKCIWWRRGCSASRLVDLVERWI